MALDKQVVSVDFTRALDTRTANKLVLGGKFTTAQDVVWRGKTPERRTGYTSLSSTISSGGFQTQPLIAGYVLGGTLALLNRNERFFTYDANAQAWHRHGNGFSLTTIAKTAAIKGRETAISCDVDSINGHTCYVANQQPTPSTDQIVAIVVDEATGSQVGDIVILTSTIGVRKATLISFANKFVALWQDGTNLKFSIFDTTNLIGGWTAPATLASMGAASLFSGVSIANRGFVAYTTPASSTVTMVEINSSGTVIAGPTVVVSLVADQQIKLGTSQDSFLYVLTLGAGGVPQRTVLNLNLTTAQATAGIGAGVPISDIGKFDFAYLSSPTSCDVYFCQTSNVSDNQNHHVLYSSLASNGTIGTVQTFIRGSYLASNPFVFNGNRYIWLFATWGMSGGKPNPQNTINTALGLFRDVNGDGTASRQVGQALLGTARVFGQVATQRPPKVIADVSGNPATVALEQFILNLSNAQNTSVVGVSRVTLKSSPTTKTILGGVVIQGGGLPSMFDGANPVELGFSQYPELLNITPVGSGGALSAGVYQYALTYEWIDYSGNRWESAATPAQSVTAVANDSVTVKLPTLRWTNKVAPRANVNLVIWRTVVNGSTLFRLTALNNSTVNDTTQDTLTFTDTAADATINSNAVLYTAGALSNIGPPSAALVISHQNRLFLTGMEDPNIVWFSRKYVSGSGINFNDTLAFRVNPWGGDNTGLASMDDRLIGFQRSAIWWISGDGPDNLGNNNTFSQPILMTKETGCIDARSIVTAPFGILFLSLKGFYLLDRGLQIQYLGAPVEGIVTPPLGAPAVGITSGVLLVKKNQVRWTTTDGRCLILDYTDLIAPDANEGPPIDRIKWSVFTNYSSADAIIWNDSYVTIGTDMAVCQDSDSANSDQRNVGGVVTTTGIAGLLETGPIKFNGVQGFQRIWRALFAGATNGGSHNPFVSVKVNYEPTYRETFSTPFQLIGGIFIQQPLPTAEPLQFRHHMQVQRCESVQFKIDFGPEIGQAPWRLENLTLEVGIKKGAFKLPAVSTL